MDSASANVAAGRGIEEAFPGITFSRCCAHALDLLVEDIAKLPWAALMISKAKQVVSFFRNHQQPRHLLRCAAARMCYVQYNVLTTRVVGVVPL